MNILLAIDDDPIRSTAIRAVREWLPAEARVVALHVGDPGKDPSDHIAGVGGIVGGGLVGMPYMAMPDLPPDDEVDRRARQVALQAAEAVGGDARVTAGDAADTILRVAAEMEADLIVVGTGDRSWLSRLLEPSVGSTVAEQASCSVLLVRQEGDADDREAS